MNTAATVVNTNIDSPKIDCAGVEAGLKILVGLPNCLVELARTDAGAQATSTPLSHLMCEPPLMRSNLLTCATPVFSACQFPEGRTTSRPVLRRLTESRNSRRVPPRPV